MGIKQNWIDIKNTQAKIHQSMIDKDRFALADARQEMYNNPIAKFSRRVISGGLVLYGGDKLADYTGIKDKIKNHIFPPPVVTAPTVAATALPPAVPPDVKPPPNHFSDNAGKYGVALGGVAAAGLGALALRRYMKKKDK